MKDSEHARRLAYLDGWRGLAILGVVVDHTVRVPGINTAQYGVELFFVLSGRLMAEILFFNNFPLNDFFVRRFTRVWPVLAIFVLVMMVTPPLAISPAAALSLITFTWNYAHILAPFDYAHVQHLWSLCVEEHSYVILGMVAYFTCRNRRKAAVAIAGIIGLCWTSMLIRAAYLNQSFHSTYWWTDIRASSILLPCLAYLCKDYLFWILRPILPLASLGAFIVATVVFSRAGVPSPVQFSLGTGLLAVSIVCLPKADPRLLRLLEVRWLVLVGTWSYSIYLWQQPILSVADYGSWQRACAAVVAIGAGFLSFRFLENPIRHYLNRQWAVRQPKAPPLRGI